MRSVSYIVKQMHTHSNVRALIEMIKIYSIKYYIDNLLYCLNNYKYSL